MRPAALGDAVELAEPALDEREPAGRLGGERLPARDRGRVTVDGDDGRAGVEQRACVAAEPERAVDDRLAPLRSCKRPRARTRAVPGLWRDAAGGRHAGVAWFAPAAKATAQIAHAVPAASR